MSPASPAKNIFKQIKTARRYHVLSEQIPRLWHSLIYGAPCAMDRITNTREQIQIRLIARFYRIFYIFPQICTVSAEANDSCSLNQMLYRFVVNFGPLIIYFHWWSNVGALRNFNPDPDKFFETNQIWNRVELSEGADPGFGLNGQAPHQNPSRIGIFWF